MLNTANILKERTRQDNTLLDFSTYSPIVYEELGFFGRKRYDRYKRLINEAATAIEEESGWRYLGNGFVQLSNYRYNPNTQQIEFNREEVDVVCNKVQTAHKSKREIAFVNRYDVLLSRIAELKSKKDLMELEIFQKELEEKGISALDDFKNPKKKKISSKDLEYMNWQAGMFERMLGTEGIRLLIEYLNKLSNSRKPMSLYKELSTLTMIPEKKEAFLSWLATYSTAGQRLLEKYKESQSSMKPREHVEEKPKQKVIEVPGVNSNKEI